MDHAMYALKLFLLCGLGVFFILTIVMGRKKDGKVREASQSIPANDFQIDHASVIERYKAILIDFHLFQLEKQSKCMSVNGTLEPTSSWHIELELVKTQRMKAATLLLGLTEKEEKALEGWAKEKAQRRVANDSSRSLKLLSN